MMRVLLVLAVASCADAPSVLDGVPVHRSAQEPYCRASNTFASVPAVGTITGSLVRPAHTFSIVARDPANGDLGVAVQSHWFSVGAMVTWAEPGVGVVATQSMVEPSYGPNGLALMRAGVPAPEAMAQLVAKDPQAAMRQLGFVDASGRAASHTGARNIAFASSHVGNGYAVQSNLMGNDRVTGAMAKAFEAAKGDLAERMLIALEAGQEVGGDIRGCQSAAMLVVSGTRSETPWKERKIDLRVEDSPAPIAELRRLVGLARAYDQMNQGDLATEKADMAAAVQHYGAAAAMAPTGPLHSEMIYWQAVSLAGHGQLDQAVPLFCSAVADDPAWRELTRRLPAAGLLDAPTAQKVLDALR